MSRQSGATPGTSTPADAVGGAQVTPSSPPSDLETVSSDSMQALLAKVAAAPSVELGTAEPGVLKPGSLIDGTYRIERKLGAGGMGMVFLAHDLELDRMVALKVHRGPTKSRDVQRLGREAKVMARLNHRHVVSVYEIGSHGEMMFVAMEYLGRGTLRAWLTETARTWRDIVEMFLDIGEGLTAAHELGIVHRDLKPDNVLVDDGGRAKVADFGLARLFGTPGDDDDDDGYADGAAGETRTRGAASRALLERFTVTGAVVGTPAYMSPEQFGGFDTSPASDQFSLAVMLYEALAGRRPFRASTTLELATAVVEGSFERYPAGVHAPRKVFDVIARALDPEASARHPSVAAMMARLRDILGQRRRRIVAGVATVVVIGALGSGFSAATALAPSPCEDAGEGLEFYAQSRRDTIDAKLRATSDALADAAVGSLDDFADAWSSQRVQACTATEVATERSDFEKGLKMACLDRMAARFDGLTATLADTGSLHAIETASDVAELLPDLALCEDVATLESFDRRFASVSSRDSTAQDRALAEAERVMARADTLLQLARPEAKDAAETLLQLATTHELAQYQLRAELLLSDIAAIHGDHTESTRRRDRAGQLAAAAGDDIESVRVMLARAEQAIIESDPTSAKLHARYAEDYMARIDDGPIRSGHELWLRSIQGRLALLSGDHHEAIRQLREVVDDGSLEPMTHEASLAALGLAYDAAGDMDEVAAIAREHIALIEKRAGPTAPEMVGAFVNLALVKADLEQYDEAHADLLHAQALLDAWEEPNPGLAMQVLGNLGYVARRAGKLDVAQDYQTQSLAVGEELYGKEHPALAYALDELGVIAREKRELDASLSFLERSRTIRTATLGAEHARIAHTESHMGRTLLAMGRAEEAAKVLTHAAQVREAVDAEPVAWAQTELELVRALAQSDPTRATQVRERARKRLDGTGKFGDPVLADLDAVAIAEG